MENCFNPLKCQNVTCKRSGRDHVLSFVHNDGRVDITVGLIPFDLPAAVAASSGTNSMIVCRVGSSRREYQGSQEIVMGSVNTRDTSM